MFDVLSLMGDAEKLWSDERRADPKSLVCAVERCGDALLHLWVFNGEGDWGPEVSKAIDALAAILKDSSHPDVKAIPAMFRMGLFGFVNTLTKQKEAARVARQEQARLEAGSTVEG